MRAVVCRELGPPERLVVEERAALVPGPGQVVIDVRAAGVNFVDTLFIRGRYQIRPEPPFVPGGEVAGNVLGVDWGGMTIREPDRNRALMERMVEGVASARLQPFAPKTYPLERGADALADLAARRIAGKAVLVTDAEAASGA